MVCIRTILTSHYQCEIGNRDELAYRDQHRGKKDDQGNRIGMMPFVIYRLLLGGLLLALFW